MNEITEACNASIIFLRCCTCGYIYGCLDGNHGKLCSACVWEADKACLIYKIRDDTLVAFSEKNKCPLCRDHKRIHRLIERGRKVKIQ